MSAPAPYNSVIPPLPEHHREVQEHPLDDLAIGRLTAAPGQSEDWFQNTTDGITYQMTQLAYVGMNEVEGEHEVEGEIMGGVAAADALSLYSLQKLGKGLRHYGASIGLSLLEFLPYIDHNGDLQPIIEALRQQEQGGGPPRPPRAARANPANANANANADQPQPDGPAAAAATEGPAAATHTRAPNVPDFVSDDEEEENIERRPVSNGRLIDGHWQVHNNARPISVDQTAQEAAVQFGRRIHQFFRNTFVVGRGSRNERHQRFYARELEELWDWFVRHILSDYSVAQINRLIDALRTSSKGPVVAQSLHNFVQNTEAHRQVPPPHNALLPLFMEEVTTLRSKDPAAVRDMYNALRAVMERDLWTRIEADMKDAARERVWIGYFDATMRVKQIPPEARLRVLDRNRKPDMYDVFCAWYKEMFGRTYTGQDKAKSEVKLIDHMVNVFGPGICAFLTREALQDLKRVDPAKIQASNVLYVVRGAFDGLARILQHVEQRIVDRLLAGQPVEMASLEYVTDRSIVAMYDQAAAGYRRVVERNNDVNPELRDQVTTDFNA